MRNLVLFAVAACGLQAQSQFQPYKATIPNTGVTFEMVPIPGGSFKMGDRTVKIGPFWMGKHEVTWDEYRLFMFPKMANEEPGKQPSVDAVSRPTRPYVEMSFGMGIEGYPAISMTHHAAVKYAEWLSAKTGDFYRLPTEAEWEYACRAGSTTAYSFGDDVSKLGDHAWYSKNSSEGKYGKVGTKKPNPWGLHDMHGNVMEWTLDRYDPKGYQGLSLDNPLNPATEPYPHAVRGGSWMDGPAALRCDARVASDPSWQQQDPQLPKSLWYHTDAQGLGFRLVRPLNSKRHRASQPHMGSLATITLYADTPGQAQQAFAKAFARIALLDSILSDYNPASELSRNCANPQSPDFANVMRYAKQLSVESGGAFDMEAGALTRLWRQARKDNRLPTAGQIQAALKLRGTMCDAGGIAKGYAADQALATLRGLGIGSALVAMSGDIALGDPPPGEPGWRVEVAGQIRILKNAGVSTSGDEFQHMDVNGVRYSHIVDPRTGEPLRNSSPVAIIANTAMEADAVATAISVGGPQIARTLKATRAIEIIGGASQAAAPPSGRFGP